MEKRNNQKSKELRIVLLALLILFLVSITGIKSEVFVKENSFPLSLEKIFDFKGLQDITGFSVEDIYDFVIPEEATFQIPAENITSIITQPVSEEAIPKEQEEKEEIIEQEPIKQDFSTQGFIFETQGQTNITDTGACTGTCSLTNVTAENNFTHLTIGNTTTGFVNATNLIFYFPFDTNASATTTYDYSGNNLNGVITGNISYNNSGIIGGGYELTGAGGYVDATVPTSLLPSSNMSWTIWVNFNTLSTTQNIIHQKFGSLLWWQANTDIEFRTVNASGNARTTIRIPDVSANRWYFLAATYDDSTGNQTLYINGTANASVISKAGEGLLTTQTLIRLGTQASDGSNNLNGTIDEVMIFNTTLTAAQVLSLYNNQSSRFFPRGEQIYKNVNVSSTIGENKANITINSTTSFSSVINVSIGNSSGNDYVYYPEAAFTNNKITDTAIGTPNNISLKFIFYAGNGSYNSFYSPTLENNISITSWDSTAPTITITTPLNNTNHSIARIDLNITSTSTDVSRWWYTNSSGQFNSSFFALGTNLSCNPDIGICTLGNQQRTWDEGHNFIIVYINDTSNNINSATANFTVDTRAPRINVSSPINNTNYSYSTININVSAVESTTLWQYWWYSNNSGVRNSSSQTPGTNLSLTWDEGHNFVYVWVNDTVGNRNYTTANFTVDTIAPRIFLDSPVNNTNYSRSTININVSAVESTTLWQYWWYSNNSGVRNSSSQTPGTNLSLTWDEGHNFVYVWVNDTVGNRNYTTANFTVDTTNPSINNALINATSIVALNTVVKVNATVTDNVAISNVTIQVDPPNNPPFNITAPSQSGNEFFNDTVVLYQAGQWVFIFHANDTVANNATQATAQDLAGNNYIEVISEGVGGPGEGSPGGGGSSSGAGTSTSISSIIQSGSETTYLLKSLGVSPLNIETPLSYIPSITINPSKESENVEIKVEEIANPNIKYQSKVYKYFEVKTTNLPDSFINNVIFTLRIPARFTNPVLYRYNNEKWASLPTTIIAEEGNFNLYEAESPGLSLFAITYKAETDIQEEGLKPKTFQPNKILKRILHKDELTANDYLLFVIIPMAVLVILLVLFIYIIVKLVKRHRKLGIAILLGITTLFVLWGYLRFTFEVFIYGIIPITIIVILIFSLTYLITRRIKRNKKEEKNEYEKKKGVKH